MSDSFLGMLMTSHYYYPMAFLKEILLSRQAIFAFAQQSNQHFGPILPTGCSLRTTGADWSKLGHWNWCRKVSIFNTDVPILVQNVYGTLVWCWPCFDNWLNLCTGLSTGSVQRRQDRSRYSVIDSFLNFWSDQAPAAVLIRNDQKGGEVA